MKKSAVVFAAVLLLAALVPQPVAAQVSTDFGLKAGVSLASYKWNDETEASDGLLQPIFGVFVAFNLSPSFAIQPEIYYLTQGGKWPYSFEEVTYLEKDFFRYLHIPVLAKVRLVKGGSLRPILFAGPAVDFLLSARAKYYTDGALDSDEDIKPYLKSTNIGLVFGAGLEHVMDKLMLILDVRYDMGLSTIAKDSTDSLKTRAWMFMLGVGF